jgi:hypothetical protein
MIAEYEGAGYLLGRRTAVRAEGGRAWQSNCQKTKNGISTVSQVKNLTTAEIGAIAVIKENSIMKNILTDLRDAFFPSQPGQVPDCIVLDHPKAENPYLS